MDRETIPGLLSRGRNHPGDAFRLPERMHCTRFARAWWLMAVLSQGYYSSLKATSFFLVLRYPLT